MAKPAPVIVIWKKRRRAHTHHGGAWKVAYADFVTAMMAFFLVMWIVAQSASVRAGVAGYFRNPNILDDAGAGVLPGQSAGAQSEAIAPLPEHAPESDVASLQQTADRIREALRRMPGLEALSGQIQIKATSEGLRIELIDSNSATFFDTASAELKPATEQILGVIAGEIATLERPVAVEGHTDSRAYTRNDRYGNWELSSDRANAARRQLEKAGLPPRLVRAVRGYADTQLAVQDDPLDPRNRRVSILVVAPNREVPLR